MTSLFKFKAVFLTFFLFSCSFFDFKKNIESKDKAYQASFLTKEDFGLADYEIILSYEKILNENLLNNLSLDQKTTNHYLNNKDFQIKQINSLFNKQIIHERQVNVNFSPVIFKERIILNNDSNIIKCFDLSGKEIWKIKLNNLLTKKKQFSNYISVFKGKYLIIHTSLGEILAFDISNIDKEPILLWKLELNQKIHSNISFFREDSDFYILTMNNNLYRINEKGESALVVKNEKTLPIFTDYKISSPFVDKNYIIYGDLNGEIFCINKKTEKIVWNFDFNLIKGENFSSSGIENFTYEFMESGKDVIIPSNIGVIAMFEKANGNIKWSRDISVNSEIIKNENFIFFLDTDNTLIAMRISDAKIKWVNHLESIKIYQLPKYLNRGSYKNFKVIYHSPVIADSFLFLTNYYGELYKISPSNGDLIEKKEIPLFLNSSLIFINGEGYSANFNGGIFKTEEEKEKSDK